MRLARFAVSPYSLILTSDAVVSAGLPFGEYKYFGVPALSGATGVRYKETGTLIGSSRIGMEIVKSYIDATGAPLADAVAAMSDNPSRALGLAKEQTGGCLAVGAAANFYIWDATLGSCTPASLSEEAE
jgi:N-acetylglucosamine-6-phosphate deacetylase